MKRFLSRLLIVLIVTAGGVSVYYWPEIRFYLQKETQQQTINDGEFFSQDIIIQKARELSKEAYKAPLEVLPAELKNLNYDQHRDIRFVRENGPWYNKRLPFEIQFFHLGAIFNTSVAVNEIVDGKVQEIKYSPAFFNYGKNNLDGSKFTDLNYAGFRLHYPLNTSRYYDELIFLFGGQLLQSFGQGAEVWFVCPGTGY